MRDTGYVSGKFGDTGYVFRKFGDTEYGPKKLWGIQNMYLGSLRDIGDVCVKAEGV